MAKKVKNKEVPQTEELLLKNQKTPVEETPLEESPVEETPLEESPLEETPVEETPLEESPVEEALIKEFVFEDEEYLFSDEAPEFILWDDKSLSRKEIIEDEEKLLLLIGSKSNLIIKK